MDHGTRCAVPDCGHIGAHRLVLYQHVEDPSYMRIAKKMFLCDKHAVDMYDFMSAYEGKEGSNG